MEISPCDLTLKSHKTNHLPTWKFDTENIFMEITWKSDVNMSNIGAHGNFHVIGSY